MVRWPVRPADEIQELVMETRSGQSRIRRRGARRLTVNDIADAAVWALREEAQLTPKPGLVDRRGCGVHRDMDLPMLLRSATSLLPAFARIADCATQMPFGMALRDRLGAIGRAAETSMFAATGGVNTHRGAIWTLGLLAAASASIDCCNHDAKEICILAGRIASLPVVANLQASHGREMFLRYGVRGARGEAENGFPHIRDVAMPALHAARETFDDETIARLHALIALIASVDDTCVLYRGGRAALVAAQEGACAVLAAGLGTPLGRTRLDALDRRLLEMNASPGGCADLLAATLFLDRLTATKEACDGNA
jgi:triphosphoribosyl-dephospho-CoA synthase